MPDGVFWAKWTGGDPSRQFGLGHRDDCKTIILDKKFAGYIGIWFGAVKDVVVLRL